MIDVNLINPFLEATLSVIKSAAQKELKIGKPEVKETVFTDKSVLIMLGVTGKLEGQVIFDISEDNAKNIASTMMFGMPVDELSDMAMSAISELGNMIMGNAATLFSKNKVIIDITPPTVARGNLTLSRQYAVNICVPLYEGTNRILNINIAVRKEQ